MLRKSIFIALLGIAVLFQGCGDTKDSTEKSNKSANDMLSSNEFILTSTDNTQYVVKKEQGGYSLKNSEGKVVIFDIFATWCPPCQASASHLTSLQEKYKDDLIVIGLSIEEGIPNTKLVDFKNRYNAKYIIVNSDQNRRLINDIALSLKLGNRFPIPIMALYKDAKLINHYIGKIQEEFVESDIKKALHK